MCKYTLWLCKWTVTVHICMVTIYHVNDFFILFFSLLSLPLTHLTLFFSFPFSPHSHRSTFPHFIKLSHFIRSTLSPTNATNPSPIADLLFFFFPHHRFVGCWLFFCCGGLFLLGCSLGCVGFDWLLVSILCGFWLFQWWLCGCLGCFRSVRDDRVWVVLGLWERWHC